MPLPDFFIIGAPKAGTTAIHAALATHPELYLSPVKEPKYFLCDDRPPTVGQNGPGDAHSAQEWIWRRDDYEALFDAAPAGRPRGESTPFYLHDLGAHGRLAAAVPDAKLIAVLRDPVDRAYSNWMHLWSDGLEPIPDFAAACAAERHRVDAGWAPIWHYRSMGRYGAQLSNLFDVFPRDQVHVLRYRDLVDEPGPALDAIATFLGVSTGLTSIPGPENARAFAPPGVRSKLLGPTIRTGAAVGAYLPPRVWRAASVPFTRALQYGGAARPKLDIDTRRTLVDSFRDDNELLSDLLGTSFADWLGDNGRGDFATRRVESAD